MRRMSSAEMKETSGKEIEGIQPQKEKNKEGDKKDEEVAGQESRKVHRSSQFTTQKSTGKNRFVQRRREEKGGRHTDENQDDTRSAKDSSGGRVKISKRKNC